MMRVIYVAGRYTGANAWEIAENVRAAERVAYEVALLGVMPLCPHANTAHFYGTKSAEFWYEGTLELLRRCDALVLVPGWETSKGVAAELAEAEARKIPVFKTLNELARWLRGGGA